jgi:ribosomal protein L34E
MAQRVTLRKRQPYNTTSNRRRIVKTPGGKLVYHHLKKPATSPKCGDCGISLPGVRLLVLAKLSKVLNQEICFDRSLLSALVNMPRSQSAKRPSVAHMAGRDVVTA